MLIIAVLLAELGKVNTEYQFDRKKENIIKHKNLLSHVKIGREILTFRDIELEKNKFYRYKSPIFLNDADIEKVLVSKKISLREKGYKYFIGCLQNDHKVKPLHIMLSKISAYVKRDDKLTK